MEVSSTLRDISIVIASVTAIYSINAWRREFKWKKRAELAEEVLALFYEAKDAIRHIRSPFAFGGEGSSRKQGEQESKEEKEAYDKAYVAIERHQKYQELFSKIGAFRYRFLIYFGRDASSPFDELRQILNEIFLASSMLSYLWVKSSKIYTYRTEEQQEKHTNEIHKYEKIFWQTLPEEDTIEPKLENAVISIEKTCQGVLQHSTLNDTFKLHKYINKLLSWLKQQFLN